MITSLNNNLFNKTYTNKSIRYNGDTAIIDDYAATIPNQSEYTVMLTFGASHPDLGGAAGLLHGFKLEANYEFQEFKSHSKNMYRYKTAGTWGAWTSV